MSDARDGDRGEHGVLHRRAQHDRALVTEPARP